ncbi:hypothetical protein ACLB2K_052927 [Fragaria x ananassa]
MDLDVDISRWVLELLLSDRRMDTIAKRVLAVSPLPVHHDWRLKKSLLLRTIESAIYDDVSVTETILQALEDIEALDRRQGMKTTAAMRAAYCAVATECTVKFLICFGRKYLEAVDRIWRSRVRVLESERSELVTAELKERRNEVEAGIWDRDVSRKLKRMNTRNDALRLVAAYVKEAWDSMGPPFLAWAVKFDMAKESDGCGKEVRIASGNELKVQKSNGADLGDGFKPEANGDNVGDGCKAEVQMKRDTKVDVIEVALTKGDDVGVRKELKGQREIGANVSDGSGVKAPREAWRVGKSNAGEVTVAIPKFGGLFGFHKGNGILQAVRPGRSAPNVNQEIPCAVPLRHKHEPVNIRDTEYVGRDASDGIHNDISTEVRKVQQELKSGVIALKAVVTDPLPYDLRVPEVVKSELEVNHVSVEDGIKNPSVEKNAEPDHSTCDTHGNLTSSDQKDVPQATTGKEYDAPSLSVDKGKATEYVRSGDPYPGDLCCSNQKSGPQPGLMKRNSTAHTYKWDDSLGMSPEGTVKGKLHLPIPIQNADSLLNKGEAKRRKVKRWSVHEADTLRTGIKEYGNGNWKVILDVYRDVFEERTEVDLKDKWRNMSKWRGTCE